MESVTENSTEALERLENRMAMLAEFPVYIGRLSLGELFRLVSAGYVEPVFLDRIGLTPKGRAKLYELERTEK